MNCSQVQGLLLTDYADDQLTSQQKAKLDAHISECAQCREFFETVRLAVEPLKNAEVLVPPEEIWQNIKESVERPGASRSGVLSGIWDWLESLFKRPVPVLAGMSFFVCLLLATMALNVRHHPNTAARIAPAQQAEYFLYLVEETDVIAMDNNDGYGTVIEEYFL